ncbi:hypothetical protein B2J93_1690 [Marssonina coronariae]|uniref:Uncharacterized protein n=1 Tax=Diplocarpon coronariae TaxID=2795749 RepID=A0A218ZC35_9HELO|nr:hypothetical protein B2J93_1690 [Marssonina coronariae]
MPSMSSPLLPPALGQLRYTKLPEHPPVFPLLRTATSETAPEGRPLRARQGSATGGDGGESASGNAAGPGPKPKQRGSSAENARAASCPRRRERLVLVLALA